MQTSTYLRSLRQRCVDEPAQSDFPQYEDGYKRGVSSSFFFLFFLSFFIFMPQQTPQSSQNYQLEFGNNFLLEILCIQQQVSGCKAFLGGETPVVLRGNLLIVSDWQTLSHPFAKT